jgi:hypothetical protein
MTMKNPKLGDYLLWEGQLAKVVYQTDQRTVGIELFDDCKCPHCNGNLGKKQINVIVFSPLFQQNAQPLQTISND